MEILDHIGSVGNNYEENSPELKPFALPDAVPDAPGQLYNLETDPGEKTNLYSKKPQIVQSLKTQLDATKKSGSSRE